MKKTILLLLSMLLLLCPAYAKKKINQKPLTASIQEVKAATLNDSDQTETPKKKKTAKAKKHHKAKKQ